MKFTNWINEIYFILSLQIQSNGFNLYHLFTKTVIFMVKEEKERILRLIKNAGKFCQTNLGYSDHTLYQYDRAWRSLLKLMEEHGIEVFNEIAVWKLEELIGYKRTGAEGKNGRRHAPTEKYYQVRSLKMLYSFQETEKISMRMGEKKNKLNFPEPINTQVKDFINYLTLKQRRKNVTVRAYVHSMSSFVEYLVNNGVVSFEELNITIILNYIREIIPDSQVTPFLQIGHIRGLARYLFQFNLTKSDLSAQIPRCKRIIQPKLPSVYSKEEIIKLLNSNPRITGLQKRDYAILLLMARLGIRVSDVVNLKFENIKWRENRIEFKQYKTGNPIELPLLADVGNALIDYIKNGRLNYKSEYVFLRQRYPYVMDRMGVSNIVNKAFKDAGIHIKGKHHGPHSLRHSLSARMLEENTIIPVITEVLGHEKAESTQYYMRIDVESLKKCMINVPELNKKHFDFILHQYE